MQERKIMKVTLLLIVTNAIIVQGTPQYPSNSYLPPGGPNRKRPSGANGLPSVSTSIADLSNAINIPEVGITSPLPLEYPSTTPLGPQSDSTLQPGSQYIAPSSPGLSSSNRNNYNPTPGFPNLNGNRPDQETSSSPFSQPTGNGEQKLPTGYYPSSLNQPTSFEQYKENLNQQSLATANPDQVFPNEQTVSPNFPSSIGQYSPTQSGKYSPSQSGKYNTNPQNEQYNPNQGRPYSPTQNGQYTSNQGRPYNPNQNGQYNVNRPQQYSPSQGRPYSQNSNRPLSAVQFNINPTQPSSTTPDYQSNDLSQFNQNTEDNKQPSSFTSTGQNLQSPFIDNQNPSDNTQNQLQVSRPRYPDNYNEIQQSKLPGSSATANQYLPPRQDGSSRFVGRNQTPFKPSTEIEPPTGFGVDRNTFGSNVDLPSSTPRSPYSILPTGSNDQNFNPALSKGDTTNGLQQTLPTGYGSQNDQKTQPIRYEQKFPKTTPTGYGTQSPAGYQNQNSQLNFPSQTGNQIPQGSALGIPSTQQRIPTGFRNQKSQNPTAFGDETFQQTKPEGNDNQYPQLGPQPNDQEFALDYGNQRPQQSYPTGNGIPNLQSNRPSLDEYQEGNQLIQDKYSRNPSPTQESQKYSDPQSQSSYPQSYNDQDSFKPNQNVFNNNNYQLSTPSSRPSTPNRFAINVPSNQYLPPTGSEGIDLNSQNIQSQFNNTFPTQLQSAPGFDEYSGSQTKPDIPGAEFSISSKPQDQSLPNSQNNANIFDNQPLSFPNVQTPQQKPVFDFGSYPSQYGTDPEKQPQLPGSQQYATLGNQFSDPRFQGPYSKSPTQLFPSQTRFDNQPTSINIGSSTARPNINTYFPSQYPTQRDSDFPTPSSTLDYGSNIYPTSDNSGDIVGPSAESGQSSLGSNKQTSQNNFGRQNLKIYGSPSVTGNFGSNIQDRPSDTLPDQTFKYQPDSSTIQTPDGNIIDSAGNLIRPNARPEKYTEGSDVTSSQDLSNTIGTSSTPGFTLGSSIRNRPSRLNQTYQNYPSTNLNQFNNRLGSTTPISSTGGFDLSTINPTTPTDFSTSSTPGSFTPPSPFQSPTTSLGSAPYPPAGIPENVLQSNDLFGSPSGNFFGEPNSKDQQLGSQPKDDFGNPISGEGDSGKYSNRNGKLISQYPSEDSFKDGNSNEAASNAKYEFNYVVNDGATNFGHHELRDGDITQGSYNVALPDGRKQIVDYQADKAGYRPKIRYEGGEPVSSKFQDTVADKQRNFESGLGENEITSGGKDDRGRFGPGIGNGPGSLGANGNLYGYPEDGQVNLNESNDLEGNEQRKDFPDNGGTEDRRPSAADNFGTANRNGAFSNDNGYSYKK